MHPLAFTVQRRWRNFWGWPGELKAAMPEDAGGKGKPRLGEIGVTGLETYGGRIKQEYNSRLQTLTERMIEFEEMRRSEPAIAVIEALTSEPVRGARWRIIPGDDLQLAERIRQNLFEELSQPFDEFLRQILLARLYGFTIHEKVWERKADGFLGWRKFAERSRRTVTAWQFDETGGLQGFEQRGINPASDASKEQVLPIEKLVVWTWRPDEGNPEGLGALRQAYKPYFFKSAAVEFAAIRIEREAVGIPVFTMPPDATDEDKDSALEQGKRLRSDETATLTLPDGWGLDNFSLGDASVPFEDFIERMHQEMLQTVLGQFVGLAQGDQSGAFALSRDASSMFLMALNTTGRWVCDTFNRYCIPQICYYNNPKPGKLPRLECGPIGVRDIDKLMTAIRNLVGPNAIVPADIESYLREEAGLPEKTPEEIEAERTRLAQEAAKRTTEATTNDAHDPAVVDSRSGGGGADDGGAGGAGQVAGEA